MDFHNINQEMDYIKKRNRLKKDIETMVEQKGYEKVDVDFFESYDSFVKQNKRIKPSTMVKLVNPFGTISVLRPDITTNIIKQVVHKWVKGAKIKVFYDSYVFRQSKNRLEELHQFGLEQLGYAGNKAESDVLNMTISILEVFDLPYKIVLGHQAFINAIFDALTLSEQALINLKNDLQAKNQAGIDIIIAQNNINPEIKRILQDLLTFEGPLKAINDRLSAYPLSKEMKEALDQLNEVYQTLSTNKDHLWVDLSLVTSYDYYNGLLLEGYIEDYPTPILQGGRYDKLTKEYGQEISAFGVSFDYQALIQEVINYD